MVAIPLKIQKLMELEQACMEITAAPIPNEVDKLYNTFYELRETQLMIKGKLETIADFNLSASKISPLEDAIKQKEPSNLLERLTQLNQHYTQLSKDFSLIYDYLRKTLG